MYNIVRVREIIIINPDSPRDRGCRFGSKVGQIGHKWYKSGAFSDQISVHLAHLSPGFEPFGANLTHFGAKPTIPATRARMVSNETNPRL